MKEKNIRLLEEEWAQRLKDSGFRDIEDTRHPDRPLIVSHVSHFTSESAGIRKERRSPYWQRVDIFSNDPQFREIILLMVKHGNCRFDEYGVERIWDLHRKGMSERTIAGEMQCSQSCIHFLLRRMRTWMGLV